MISTFLTLTSHLSKLENKYSYKRGLGTLFPLTCYPLFPLARYPPFPLARYPLFPLARYPLFPRTRYPLFPLARYPPFPLARYPLFPPVSYTHLDASGGSSGSSSGGSFAPCEISLEERLLQAAPIWYLPDLHRLGAVHLLQAQRVGVPCF
ncbi:hypothetical protein HAZT_HAZT001431 [Hyalella azteca]|uniref:Uncharacterized protein n=1 Tax=Hyalella azteca TaxID=294128 RepID=A0A6A0H4W5_HYAAZ|nr:hypothetical protein HAZT_HAZT001431 [Hyalella azteca]